MSCGVSLQEAIATQPRSGRPKSVMFLVNLVFRDAGYNRGRDLGISQTATTGFNLSKCFSISLKLTWGKT